MKRVGKLWVCLAGGLVLHAGLRAGAQASSDNPYVPIVTRNIFGISPPPPPVDPNAPKPEPLPKITLNGIISSVGHVQALFKVVYPPKPGQPPKEQSYILGVGEGQDNIEVTKIDEAAQIVTFDNDGTTQEVPLQITKAGGPPGPAPRPLGPVVLGSRPNTPAPVIPAPTVAPAANPGASGVSITRFGQAGGGVLDGQKPRIVIGGNDGNDSGTTGGAIPGSRLGVALGGAGARPGRPAQNTMSVDDHMVLVTANHLIAQQAGDPAAAIFPPTPYDPEAGVTPNVAQPTPPGGAAPQRGF